MGVKIKQLAVGREHCLALASEGIIYSWGDNSKHQLGIILEFDEDGKRKVNAESMDNRT
jgi:alpha-tubulin suppressor-like RCC1 family protein